MKYLEIQNDLVRRCGIVLCDGSLCRNDWHRTHAHVKERRVCKWKPKNSVQSTFELMHEIGHIETTKTTMRRCESEYYATLWALKAAEHYSIVVPQKTLELYQRYIFAEYIRGLRRGGRLPDIESFRLPGAETRVCIK